MSSINYIKSLSNSRIKYIKGLHRKKNRVKEGLFIIEGSKIVEECIEKNYRLETLLVSEDYLEGNEDRLDALKEIADEMICVDNKIYDYVSDTETPQGILAVSKIISRDIDSFIREDGFYLILDGLQDPGNMGTIIRTADAFGVKGIFLSEGCVDVHNSKVVRATMGSIFRLPIYNIDDLEKFKRLVGEINIYSSSLEADEYVYNLDFSNSMLIIGNESKGVSREYQALATRLVKIPMLGEAESLNAAVASSVVMYEAMRQSMV